MLTIGVVARHVRVRSSTIRYYEARGLLKPATRLPNGYRAYDEGDVALLHFVRRAQTLGLTLKEVSEIADLSRRGREPCARVQQLARRHLQDIDLKVRQLKLLRKELQELLRRRPRWSGQGEVCPLIERVEARQERRRENKRIGFHR